MTKSPKLYALISSPHYPEILKKYNDLLSQKKKINKTAFFTLEVKSKVPELTYQNWYGFLQRAQAKDGFLTLIPPSAGSAIEKTELIVTQEKRLQEELQNTSKNTQQTIAGALAIGAVAMQEIMSNPGRISLSERMKIFYDAMKAQDSRIRAIAELKKDAREERAFNKVFEDATYAGAITAE